MRRAARFLSVDTGGKLWAKHPTTEVSLHIPPIYRREGIIKEALQQLGFPNGQQLAAALKGQVFWQGMQQDCIEVSQASRPRQVEGARFPLPPYLKPCEKGGGPFWIWVLDLIVRVKPVGPGGISHIIVAVCTFTKWVELGALASVDAGTVR